LGSVFSSFSEFTYQHQYNWLSGKSCPRSNCTVSCWL